MNCPSKHCNGHVKKGSNYYIAWFGIEKLGKKVSELENKMEKLKSL